MFSTLALDPQPPCLGEEVVVEVEVGGPPVPLILSTIKLFGLANTSLCIILIQ